MWERKLAGAVLRHRIAVLAGIAVLSIVAAVYAVRVELESSIEIWFLDDDPALVSYEKFLDRFEADEYAVVGIFAPDVFEPGILRAVDRVTREAEKAPHVNRVLSLTNVEVFRSLDGAVEIAPLVPEIPEGSEGLERLKSRALRNPLVSGLLVSSDATAAAVLVEMLPEGNTVEGKTRLDRSLRDLASQLEARGVEVHLSGSPVFDAAFFRYAEEDLRWFGPAVFLLVVVATFVVYRRVSATLIPLSVVLLATLWTHGVMGFFDMDVNIVSTMLTALILAVGVADSVHVLSEYTRQLMLGKARDEAVEESMVHLLAPCFFTSTTTAIGLLSLLVSDLAPVRDFGWLSALGVTFAFVLSVTFVPAVLGLTQPPDPAFVERQRVGPLSRLLELLGRPTPASSRWILAIFAVLLLGAFGAMSLLEVGSNPINYLHPQDPVRKDMKIVDERLGGSSSVEFFVEAPNRGLTDPETLERLDDLQGWLEERPGILQTLSILDALKEVNRVFHDGDPEKATLPDSRALAAQYYLIMEGEEDFEAFVQDDSSVGRITGRISITDAQRAIHDMEHVETRLDEEFSGPELSVEATGFLKLMADMETYLIRSQIRTFLLAFGAITLIMILLLRSIRFGLFSMIPNLGPIVLGLGWMGLVGIPLDPATVMIASIALGLVVDDSVHFLFRLQSHARNGVELGTALRRTMLETGRPIIVTTVVLAASFSILGFGAFLPNAYFGLVSALVVCLALVADLVVLPAALVLGRRFHGWPLRTG